MRRPLGVLLLTVAALVGLELALVSRGHGLPGESVAFGLLGCAVIVGVAKALAGLGLQRAAPPDE